MRRVGGRVGRCFGGCATEDAGRGAGVYVGHGVLSRSERRIGGRTPGRPSAVVSVRDQRAASEYE
ncbi:hypothetical protein SSCG_04666 [Streptomyces clavuligerus]|nr:hypothetical protein SSCG_04666 [Streptomyces clavuligerus]